MSVRSSPSRIPQAISGALWLRARWCHSHKCGAPKMPSAESMPGTPVLVRYADDLAVCCHSRQEAEQVKGRLAEWLVPMGLSCNENKTRIVHLVEGFDFLGFNI